MYGLITHSAFLKCTAHYHTRKFTLADKRANTHTHKITPLNG